jgi:hypothetical protein
VWSRGAALPARRGCREARSNGHRGLALSWLTEPLRRPFPWFGRAEAGRELSPERSLAVSARGSSAPGLSKLRSNPHTRTCGFAACCAERLCLSVRGWPDQTLSSPAGRLSLSAEPRGRTTASARLVRQFGQPWSGGGLCDGLLVPETGCRLCGIGEVGILLGLNDRRDLVWSGN